MYFSEGEFAVVNNNSKLYGAEGEQVAVNYLITAGYTIIERNWRFKKLEVDIIAIKDQSIVFVEVKTRKNDTFGEPESFVSRKQQSFLISAANHYVLEKDIDLECRFDVIAISDLYAGDSFKHIEGAFFPTAK